MPSCGREACFGWRGKRPFAWAVRILTVWSFCPAVTQPSRCRAGKILNAPRCRRPLVACRGSAYQGQGILVEPEVLEHAEQESLADAEARARRQERAANRREVEDREFITAFAGAIREQYPGRPAKEATEIAKHACRKYSGRVGRTAAAKELSPDAIRLAVIAHIRHAHTEVRPTAFAVRRSRVGTGENQG